MSKGIVVGVCSICNQVRAIKEKQVGGNGVIVVCVNCTLDNVVLMNITCNLCDKLANTDYRVSRMYTNLPNKLIIGKITCGPVCGKILEEELRKDPEVKAGNTCVCGAKSVEGLECGRCHFMFYCSKECQDKDEERHKEICQPLPSDKEEKID